MGERASDGYATSFALKDFMGILACQVRQPEQFQTKERVPLNRLV